MKKVLVILFVLLSLGLFLNAQRIGLRDPAFMALLPRASAPTVFSYFFTENFEGTGYENGTGAPNGWGESGAGIDEDYTGIVLQGAQSCYFDTSVFRFNTNAWASGAKDVVFGYFMLCLSNTPNQVKFNLSIPGTSDEFQAVAMTSGTSTFTVYNGHTNSTGTTSLVNGRIYHVWTEYDRDTDGGAFSGISRLWLATNAIKPVTVECEVTTGDSVAQPTAISLQSLGNDQAVFDKIRLSDTAIGSNPN